MKCAIYGAGSLGTVLGAYLSQNGVDIELVNRNKAHVEALNRNGAHVCGTVDFTAKVKALTPEEMVGPYDVIFLLTKQLFNQDVVTFLKPLLAEDGVIVTFQNGIPEPSVAEVVGKERTMGCVVEWGATLKGPGEVELTSEPDGLFFHMGKMEGISDEKLQTVKEILEKMCTVEIEENLMGARWSKLLINATFSGIGSAIGGNFGDVYATKEGKRLALRCMKECIDVGTAAGVTFAPVQGNDITKLFYYKNGLKRTFAGIVLPIAMRKHALIEPSMLQDLRNKKPCEIDAINGVVCQWGKKLGIPTPVNDKIVEIVKKEQRGELKISKSNLELFREIGPEK